MDHEHQIKGLVDRGRQRRLRRREFLKVVVGGAGLALGSLVGCGQQPAPSSPAPAGAQPSGPATPAAKASEPVAPAAKPVKKGGTLRLARPYDANTLDPWADTYPQSRQIIDNMNEPLVRIDWDLKYQPCLAESWERTDPVTWVFKLRKGVKFHTGAPFNAQAVKFNFDRYLDPKTPGKGAGQLSAIGTVSVVDDYTVSFKTKVPTASFLADLTPPWASMVDPSAVQKYGNDYQLHPSGTGPFMFESWKKADSVTLVRNPDWWGGDVPLDKVIFRPIPEDATRVMALDNGEVDMIFGVPADKYNYLKGRSDSQVVEATSLRTVGLYFNTARFPTDEKAVRQALSYAIDVDSICKFVLEDVMIRAKGFMAPNINGFADVGVSNFDQAKAAQLLEGAGWKKGSSGFYEKNGKTLKFTYDTPESIYAKDRQIAETVQGQLRKFGVDMDVKVWENMALLAARQKGEYNLTMFGWTVQTADGDYALYPPFHSSQFKGWNLFFYKNDDVDKWLDTARASTNADERKDLYKKVQTQLREDMPMIPLYHLREMDATKKYVMNWRTHPGDHQRVWPVWLDK